MSDGTRAHTTPSALENKLGSATARAGLGFALCAALGCAFGTVLGCASTPGDLFHEVPAPDAPVDTSVAPPLAGSPPVVSQGAPTASVTQGPAVQQPTTSLQAAASSGGGQLGSAAPGADAAQADGAPDDSASSDGAEDPANAPGAPPPAAPAAPRQCPALTQPLLLDFAANPSADPAQALFGDFATTLSGGTFVYPALPEAFALSSEVTSGYWHIAGAVGAVSGFGLFFDCDQIDASAFDGLSFSISGDVTRDSEVTLLVGTASDQVSSSWLLASGTDPAAPPSFGRCTPTNNPFDGSCNTPRVTVPVRRGQRRIDVRFRDLGEGSPVAGVNPAEITSIAWALPAPATSVDGSTEPYDIDLRIDDIRFLGR